MTSRPLGRARSVVLAAQPTMWKLSRASGKQTSTGDREVERPVHVAACYNRSADRQTRVLDPEVVDGYRIPGRPRLRRTSGPHSGLC